MTRNERLTGILLALQSGRTTASHLARRFEVSRRTILRDVDALSQLGVPVVALPGPSGGYELTEGFWLPPLQFTADEASLLLLALQRFGAAEASPFGPARQTVEEKLRSALPAPVIHEADRQNSAIAVESPHRWEHLGHFRGLQHAVLHERWVRIGYRSSRRMAEHDLLPLRLSESAGRWYLTAWSPSARAERRFRVDRIASLTQIPAPISVTNIVPNTPNDGSRGGELIEVVAQLTYTACRRLEDHADFNGKIVEHEGGGVLRFDTPLAELDYFARELFALGAEIAVVMPAELRMRVIHLADETIRQYAKDNGDTTVSPIDR